jgi:hypothetical protein
MPNISGTTRRQTIFLRSFLKNRGGPAPADWPTPPILRRWLRRPTFLSALNTIRQTLHFQSDLLLAFAAASASLTLQQTPPPDSNIANPKSKMDMDVLRLSHLRQRFPAAHPKFSVRTKPPSALQDTYELLMESLKIIHPDANAREALQFLAERARTPQPAPLTDEAQRAIRDRAMAELASLEHPSAGQ